MPETGIDTTRTAIIIMIALTYLGAGILTYAFNKMTKRINKSTRRLADEILAARRDASSALSQVEKRMRQEDQDQRDAQGGKGN